MEHVFQRQNAAGRDAQSQPSAHEAPAGLLHGFDIGRRDARNLFLGFVQLSGDSADSLLMRFHFFPRLAAPPRTRLQQARSDFHANLTRKAGHGEQSVSAKD